MFLVGVTIKITDFGVADECDDLETFLSLNNDYYIRLELTTKMIRAIQTIQKDCESELPVEEFFVNIPIEQQALENPSGPTDGKICIGIDLEKSLWFHKHGRGRNKHSGKLHFRMETLSKKSDERIIVRPSKKAPQQHQTQPTISPELETPNLTELLSDLQFIVPCKDTRTQIFELWKQTHSYRNEQRVAGKFMEFLNDYPQSLAFGGVLIAEDFVLSHPNCKEFDSLWDDLEIKVLIVYKLYTYIKHKFSRALAILREKNPTKGRKNMKDMDARKANPLHGVVDWIECKEDITACDVPQLFVLAKEYEEGDCFLVWKDLLIPLDGGIRAGFVLLLQCFSTFGVKSLPSDAAFFSFFYSIIFGIERPSSNANKFFMQLK